jgi:sugar-specific transcriptional regulator TrmB
MIEAKHIQTLKDFGLSSLQAKIYLVLVNLGKADVKTIARESNVARQEIYRIMPALQKLGLEEKIIGKPITYKATPLEDGLSILLQKQEEECYELQNKKNWLLSNFHPDNIKTDLHEDDAQLIVISEITLFFNTYKELIKKTQNTIDTIIPLSLTPTKFYNLWSHVETEMTMKRPLKIRLITQKSRKNLGPPRCILEHHLFEFKYLTEPVPFGMHIYDKKKFSMSMSEKSGLPSLWSNNPNMVILAQNYFDSLWNKATKS